MKENLKYNKGRVVEGHWVFGGCERGSSEAFMTVVNDRSAATLMPIIRAYIRPGTTISVMNGTPMLD